MKTMTFLDAKKLPYGTSVADMVEREGGKLWDNLQVRWYMGLLYNQDESKKSDLPFPHTVAFKDAVSLVRKRFGNELVEIWAKNIKITLPS